MSRTRDSIAMGTPSARGSHINSPKRAESTLNRFSVFQGRDGKG
jgi:hypothetical protein